MTGPGRWRRGRLHSFGYAASGLRRLVAGQPNAWVHLFATCVVVALGLLLGLSWGEWAAVVLAIGLVWTAEALNTAVEILGDAVSAEEHPLVGQAKDLGAAAVLIASLTAVVVGLVVFLPKMSGLLELFD
ncbi:diacylglycerol kinase [Mucisphaera calidilacus]|uniref:Undecaprenol kinase n=1 Tax=Mucisphaera calidilacus TaxID=2527982 RepID=A0A518BZH6_9BACT|nr:diacylglycerol kinase family protein [Mucisphaera calidilacus]QDU72383.1 Undecaprenol kinase [Mucisphaera calidilacus]